MWGREYVDEVDYLRVYVRRLRDKLGDDPEHPRYIRTERGLGYRPGCSHRRPDRASRRAELQDYETVGAATFPDGTIDLREDVGKVDAVAAGRLR